MGYSLSWVAVRGRPFNAVCSELGLQPDGKTETLPEGDFCFTSLETGWHVILTNLDARFAEEATLARLSRDCEAIGCFVEEHVMMSAAAGWRDGRIEWAVSHQAEVSLDHLEAQGAGPPDLARLEGEARASRQAEPGGPDFFFDVPVRLALEMTGFSHTDERSFEGLKLTNPPPKKSWLKKFLGG